MEDILRNRLLLVLVLALASVIVSAGGALAGGGPNGLCVCITINGHCYTIGGC